MFESALEAGLSAAGVDVLLTGPMPTPAIAYLTRTFRANAGIVISASHNVFSDNGIKFFSSDGTKLPDNVEHAIEAQMDLAMTTVPSAELGKARRVEDAAGRYIEFCKGTLNNQFSLKGMRIVLDCANGATYHVAPKVLSELGAEVIEIGSAPDGVNINDGCGATAPERLQTVVKGEQADLGIALDGDGDRVILVDHAGDVVDGDEILFIIAKAWQSQGLMQGGVVGTLMSNLGLEQALERLGLPFVRANVGDRYVIEQMLARGWQLGGESSGHIVCSNLTTTGDGLVAALQVLKAMQDGGQTLQQLKSGMQKMPQTMINVAMPVRVDVMQQADVAAAVHEVEAELGERGRVLLRPSGTEPVVRVMVEGQDSGEVEMRCASLAERVQKALQALASQ